jgi:hypothetical protein
MSEDKIKWKQISSHKPGDKPLTWMEQKHIVCKHDQNENKALEISLGLQANNPKFPPPDPVILKPELHVKPCSLCY